MKPDAIITTKKNRKEWTVTPVVTLTKAYYKRRVRDLEAAVLRLDAELEVYLAHVRNCRDLPGRPGALEAELSRERAIAGWRLARAEKAEAEVERLKAKLIERLCAWAEEVQRTDWKHADELWNEAHEYEGVAERVGPARKEAKA